jgi:hypothetical protein
MTATKGNPSEQEMLTINFSGGVTSDHISEILTFIDKRFREMKAKASTRRKITSVLVESLQNIFHHGPLHGQGPGEHAESKVIIRREDGDFLVITGNHIPADRAQELKVKIEGINSMTREELNLSYRHILFNKLKTSKMGVVHCFSCTR